MQIKQIKKLFLTSALAMTMAMPAMADVDIAAGANTADCDSDVLKTTTGPANLEANWDPNTISLNWYAGSDSNTPLTVQTGAQTCTYDGAITLPATQPTKPGYTFDHWIVRQLFDLSTLSSHISENSVTFASKSINPGEYCEGMLNEEWYGNDEDEDCSDSRFDVLNDGEWYDTFTYGTVRGEAICSTTAGNRNGLYTNNNYNILEGNIQSNITAGSGDTKYCWCKPTGFDAENDGTFVGVASPSWVFRSAYDSASNCANHCANYCADDVLGDSGFRAAIYGVTQ